MEEVNTIIIDNEEYVIADEIIIDGQKYVYLSKEDAPLDYIIWKVITDNGEDFLIKLKSDEEFDKALQAFFNKHKNKLK